MRTILKSIAIAAIVAGTPSLSKADAIGDGGMVLAVGRICDIYVNDEAMMQAILLAAVETGIDDVDTIKVMMQQSGKLEIMRVEAKLKTRVEKQLWCGSMRQIYLRRNILVEGQQ